VSGEVVGIWRRGGTLVDVEPWRRITRAQREAVEAEARSLPLPDVAGRIRVTWIV
jgi:hypothetical protein